MPVETIINALQALATAKQRDTNVRFFKMNKGQYAAFDHFIGVRTPQIRAIAAQHFRTISPATLRALVRHHTHEIRHCALIILVNQYQKATPGTAQQAVFETYLANIKSVNNWDLVDTTAPKIIGDFLHQNSGYLSLLFGYARSNDLWLKRIAIVSTLTFIQHNSFDATLDIARILLNDKHDLIHKASGWMLREIYKKDAHIAEQFLQDNYADLPRTTLRYAIERMPALQRQHYLKGDF